MLYTDKLTAEHTYTLTLAAPDATLDAVGGKGTSLARMAASGLPIPDGFHITTAAYRAFVAANALQPVILAALEHAEPAQPASLDTASRTIAAAFARGQIPPDIVDAIIAAYADLDSDQPPVAVRSSATAEDLPDASFAGQQETFLNVRGPDALLQAVRRCWASLWTARAIGYRALREIPAEEVSLAVVVQVLVPATAAGILFTANPVSGARDECVINAAWGLGEAIVGGHVTPDTIVVQQGTGTVLSRETAVKTTMTVRTESGTREEPVPDTLRSTAVLDDASAAALAWLGEQIQALYGRPMDIEWALAQGEFAILQARPITALPVPADLIPQDWPLPDPKATYMRTSIIDFMPDPLTPIFISMGVPRYNAGLQQLMAEIANAPGAVPDDMLLTINDYAYMQTGLSAREMWRISTRLLVAMPRILRTMKTRWKDEVLPKYRASVEAWEQRPLEELDAVELLQGAHQVLEAAIHYLNALQAGPMGGAAGAEGLYTLIYNKLIRRAGDPPAATLLLGFDSTPIQSDKDLFDLADWCEERPVLAHYLRVTPSEHIARVWRSDEAPHGVDPADWTAWRQQLHAHLRRYGYAIYDLDFAKPLPADMPELALESLKMYLRGAGSDPYARQRRLAEAREHALATIRKRTRGLRRRLFEWSLGLSQTLTPMREDCIAEIGLGYPVLRAMLREIGQRLRTAGALNDADDIFWLTDDEVAAAAAALDSGLVPSSMAGMVADRRLRWEARRRVTPPPQLPVGAKWLGMNTDIWLPAEAGAQEDHQLKGLGASPGRVTAVARVLRGPEAFDEMRPGDILVAAVTTPAWTPLFAMAAGIVTDVGGPLSHGSIVAREYGIPAVLGTGVATNRIQSGQLITVDGDSGIVRLAVEQSS